MVEETATSDSSTTPGLDFILVVLFLTVVVVSIGALIYRFYFQEKPTEGVEILQISLAPTGLETPKIQKTPLILSPSPIPPEEKQNFIVEGFEYAFNPSVLRVQEGKTVRIEFKNTGSEIHDLVIDELDTQTAKLQPGGLETIEFKIPINGPLEYLYYCTINDHRVLGMEGRIEVVE